MAIIEADTDDVRRKIDEQDRLDAKEIMVNAMLGSVGSVSSRSSGSPPMVSLPSSQRRAGANRIPMQLSASSIRRARPPIIPLPPILKKEVVAERKWTVQKAFAFAILGIAALGAVVELVIYRCRGQLPQSFKIRAAPVVFVDKPVRLRNRMPQSTRIQHTKSNGTAISFSIHANVKDFKDRNSSAEIPVLWRIPFSGDEAWTEIMGTCMGLIQAADERELLGVHLTDKELMYVETPRGTFFNLDLTENDGIEQAKTINLATLNRVDAVTSPNLNVLSLFDNLDVKCRAFTTFRHPAARLVVEIQRQPQDHHVPCDRFILCVTRHDFLLCCFRRLFSVPKPTFHHVYPLHDTSSLTICVICTSLFSLTIFTL